MKYLSYVFAATALVTSSSAQSWSLSPSYYFSSSSLSSPWILSSPFDSFLSDPAVAGPSYLRGFQSFMDTTNHVVSPRYEIKDDDKWFHLSVNVPTGANVEDIHITVKDNNMLLLTVSSERQEQRLDDPNQRYSYSFSKFSRSFSLDPTVDVDKLTADLKDGVLTVVAPKKDVKALESNIRMIPIHISIAADDVAADADAAQSITNIDHEGVEEEEEEEEETPGTPTTTTTTSYGQQDHEKERNNSWSLKSLLSEAFGNVAQQNFVHNKKEEELRRR